MIFFLLAVSIDYFRFSPAGTAILTMIAPDYTRNALQAAKTITFTGCDKIRVYPTLNAKFFGQRFRGAKGRAEALSRGILTGSGPSAWFPAGKTVIINGFPGRSTVQDLRPFIEGFELKYDETTSVLLAPM
jgi:hypothetical protein